MIKSFLKSFSILTDGKIESFIQLFATKNLKKAYYFIRRGETCKEVAFVLAGTLRFYYVTEEGAEITYC